MVWQNPTRFAPVTTLLQRPLHHCHWLSVGCCVPLSNGGHLRPRPCPSLYFLMCFVCAPPPNKWFSTRECKFEGLRSFNTLLGSRSSEIWGHHCLIHPERAKLLDKAAAAAHFDCCVCVCGCVLCVGATFSYHMGRKSTSAKAKWPTFVHSYHKIYA